jgi:hypothetical protein
LQEQEQSTVGERRRRVVRERGRRMERDGRGSMVRVPH